MVLKRLLIFLGIVLFLALLSVYYPYLTGEAVFDSVVYEREKCFVNRIIDGDTLVCDNETIRLLGIDNKEV